MDAGGLEVPDLIKAVSWANLIWTDLKNANFKDQKIICCSQCYEKNSRVITSQNRPVGFTRTAVSMRAITRYNVHRLPKLNS